MNATYNQHLHEELACVQKCSLIEGCASAAQCGPSVFISWKPEPLQLQNIKCFEWILFIL